jgi:hypothetical protein
LPIEVASWLDRVMQALNVTFVGAIVERQSFLDGSRVFTIEGEDQPSLGWRVSLTFRWPVAAEDVDEGDLTLVLPDGGEIYGSLTGGTAAEVTDELGETNAARFELDFGVTGGDGPYARVSGRLHVRGTIAGEGAGTAGSFEGEGVLLTVEMWLEGAPDLSRFHSTTAIPTSRPSPGTDAAGRQQPGSRSNAGEPQE